MFNGNVVVHFSKKENLEDLPMSKEELFFMGNEGHIGSNDSVTSLENEKENSGSYPSLLCHQLTD
jgi:hypothetical protein